MPCSACNGSRLNPIARQVRVQGRRIEDFIALSAREALELIGKSGNVEAVIFTFEPSASQEQVDAAVKVLTHVYPMKPKQVSIDRAPIVWELRDNGKTAYAKLGEGQGEVTLTRFEGPNGGPVVINNLKYWGADRNKGFNLYRSEHHYKGHGQDYSYKDANGFTIEIDTGSPASS